MTMTLKVQLVMFCCKKTYLYNLLCSCLFYIFNHAKTGAGVVAFEIK